MHITKVAAVSAALLGLSACATHVNVCALCNKSGNTTVTQSAEIHSREHGTKPSATAQGSKKPGTVVPKPRPTQTTGYSRKDRRELNQVIQSTST